MNNPIHIALLAILILLTKHLVFDFFLQTAYQYQNKGIYGHPGGILHAGLHIFGTSFLFLYVYPGAALAAQILIGEFIVHYHIDWTKEQIIKRMKLTPDNAGFWWALGTDQFLHGASYIVIAWIALSRFAQ